jgi:hypothetical protein
MKTLLFAASAAMLVMLVSCESTGTTAVPKSPAAGSFAGKSAAAAPFAGGAPPSAAYVPPERYYAFGGGYTSSRRQTEGDEVNFLRNAPWCRKHWHCGYYNGGCGYGYGWGAGGYRSGCW